MDPFDHLTPEEKEQMKRLRDRGFESLKKICFLQIGLGVVSIAVGIATLVYTVPNPSFPYIVASPLWTGVLVCLGGVLGLLAANTGIHKNDVATNVKCYVIFHYVINVLGITILIGSAALGIIGALGCRSSEFKAAIACFPNSEGLFATSVVSAIIAIFLAISCILGCCYFCCYARSLGFKSKRERRLEFRMMAMQRQLNTLQGQGQIQDQGLGHPNHYNKW